MFIMIKISVFILDFWTYLYASMYADMLEYCKLLFFLDCLSNAPGLSIF